MRKTKEQKGITLVALVITIIILLILAGISISALTNQGIFAQANRAKKEAQRAQVTEWLNLKLIEEKMNKPTGTAEEIIEATRQNVIENKNELEKIGNPVTVEDTKTEEDGEKVAIYFYVQVDEDVYKVEMAGAMLIDKEAGSIPDLKEGDITFTYKVDGQIIDKDTWTNKEVIVTASTEITGYTLQTSKDGKTWSNSTSQTFTENGKIYATLYDGRNYGSSVVENVSNIDTKDPEANIQLISTSPITSSTLPVQINTKVVHSDEQSGINISETSWVLSNNSEKIGTNKELYTEKFTGENEEKPITLNEVGKYYLHVLTIDNAGNKIETISSEISVTSELHVHNGNTSSGGGCYGRRVEVLHSHTVNCFYCAICRSQGTNDKNLYGNPTDSWMACWGHSGTISPSCGRGQGEFIGYTWQINCGKVEGQTVEAYEVTF